MLLLITGTCNDSLNPNYVSQATTSCLSGNTLVQGGSNLCVKNSDIQGHNSFVTIPTCPSVTFHWTRLYGTTKQDRFLVHVWLDTGWNKMYVFHIFVRTPSPDVPPYIPPVPLPWPVLYWYQHYRQIFTNSTISAKNYSKNSIISKSCTTTSNTSTCTTNHNLNYIYHGAQHPINVHTTLSVSTSFTSLQGASTYYWIILLLFAGIGTQIEMWGVFMTEVQTTVSICIMYLKHLRFVVLVKCYITESIISVWITVTLHKKTVTPFCVSRYMCWWLYIGRQSMLQPNSSVPICMPEWIWDNKKHMCFVYLSG